VIEGASGAKYVDFVRQNVLVPAQMERTQADNRFAIIPYRTRFYEKTESDTVRNADFLDSSYKIPGGGWLSSAEDMARFEVAILNDRLIRRTTRDFDVDATEALRRIDPRVWSRLALGRRE
jgi:serine beta-lactamase-like protein LACTB, mitochondrial